MKNQKTILVTVGISFVARNILRSDVLKTILEKSGAKIIAVLPAGAKWQFNDLASERVIFVGAKTPKQNILRKAFLWFCRNLVFTSTTYVLYGATVKGEPKRLSVFFRRLVARTFGRFRFLKNNMEKIDLFFFRQRPYKEIFEKYRSSLVFATNLLNDSLDGEILKEAKRRRIFTIGMPKSWDSFNKLFVHLKSDALFVWNEVVEEESISLQGYKKDNISVVGMPQNDNFVKRKGVIPRKDFLASIGFKEDRPLVLFGSGGEYAPEDNKVLGVLVEAIKTGEIKANVLVRPYCGTPNAERYGEFGDLSFLRINSCPAERKEWGKKWALFDEDHFANSLAHADVLVTFASTLAVDASFFDTPVVLAGFDLEPKPRIKSIRRYYETKHYKNIIDTGGVRLALSKEDFIKFINGYLQNRDLDAEKRLILRDRIGGPSDGHVGERIGNIILKILQNF